VLVGLLVGRLHGRRAALERAARSFLRDRPRNYLTRVVADHRFALAAVAALVASTTAMALPPVNLSDVVAGDGGFVMNGIDAFDQSGESVSGAGDVNGDGVPDLIVGAPGFTYSNEGESYVVFGKADGTPVDLSEIVAGTGGFVIVGYQSFGFSGGSVSGAGDVNGDGLADLIVGGRYYGARESYVVFGKPGTDPVDLADIVAGSGGFVIKAITPGSANDIINSVSGAGDVNGDGLADLIVGAPHVSSQYSYSEGESYVVFGKADTTPVELSDVVAGAGGFAITGIDPGDLSGYSVSGAGDVNGDGLADVIVGAPGAGESYVVFGKADTASVTLSDVTAGIGGFVINGIHHGRSVSGAGDVNGDGLADVIVGAFGADAGDNNSNEGESYVVLGKRDTTPVFLSDVVAGTGGFVINGIDPGDFAGSVSGAGDVNGDGLDDLIVGAYRADPGGNNSAGESYVVFSPFVPPCPWDLDGDGNVGITDLLMLLGDFGSCDGSPADFDGDGCVTVLDLLAQLLNFGPCPDGGCPWDVTGDGNVDLSDLFQVFGNLGPCDGCPEDINDDGVVDGQDMLAVITHFGPCP